ncbi:hypothetical protein [Streptomyces sp. 8N706]|uniref:hypothetical protein n=1 Tax=Streptomyces sp. 8N706 TaxID=3457416 RepID=UPI003FD673B2
MSQRKLSAAERLAARIRGVEPSDPAAEWPGTAEQQALRSIRVSTPAGHWHVGGYQPDDDGPPSAA